MRNPLDVYEEVKSQNNGALLLFKSGDFYEAFYDDAKTLANVCGLTITTMTKGSSIPMAGFPYHSLDKHLSALIRFGQRVAICEFVKPNC